MMKNPLYILLGIVAFLFFIVVMPWLTIEAFQELFNPALEFNFRTWLSTVWLMIVFGGGAHAVTR